MQVHHVCFYTAALSLPQLAESDAFMHRCCTDGHELPEQQARRAAYLQQLNTVWHRVVKNADVGKLLQRPVGTRFTVEEQATLGCTLIDVPGPDGAMVQELPVVILYHDESTFYRRGLSLLPITAVALCTALTNTLQYILRVIVRVFFHTATTSSSITGGGILAS